MQNSCAKKISRIIIFNSINQGIVSTRHQQEIQFRRRLNVLSFREMLLKIIIEAVRLLNNAKKRQADTALGREVFFWRFTVNSVRVQLEFSLNRNIGSYWGTKKIPTLRISLDTPPTTLNSENFIAPN